MIALKHTTEIVFSFFSYESPQWEISFSFPKQNGNKKQN